MADQEIECANNSSGDPVLAPRTVSARQRPCHQNSSREGVPDACGDQRRDRLDRIADRKIRRAPHDVDRREGEQYLDLLAAMAGRTSRVGIGNEHWPASYIYQFAAADEGHDLSRMFEKHNLTSKYTFIGYNDRMPCTLTCQWHFDG